MADAVFIHIRATRMMVSRSLAFWRASAHFRHSSEKMRMSWVVIIRRPPCRQRRECRRWCKRCIRTFAGRVRISRPAQSGPMSSAPRIECREADTAAPDSGNWVLTVARRAPDAAGGYRFSDTRGRRPARRGLIVSLWFAFVEKKLSTKAHPPDAYDVAAQVGESIGRARWKLRDITAASVPPESARGDVTSPAGNPHANVRIRR